MAKKPTKEEMAETRFYKKRGVKKYKPPVKPASPRKLKLINPTMKHPQQAKGPFMMAPGNGGSIKSAQNSPGPFRGDSSAVMFFKQPKMEHPMMKHPMNVKPDFPDVDGDGNKKEPISKAQKDLQAQKKPQMGGMMKPNDYHK
jgi:hypothetical protein